MNKPGRIGRDGEHTVRGYLEGAGFSGVEREGKRAASLDIVATDLTVPVEVKRRGTLSVPAWTRELEARHPEGWALFIVQRDARRNLHPDMMIVPAAMGARMLYIHETLPDSEQFLNEIARSVEQ